MFVNFMEDKGYSWNDFDYCYQMATLIEEYAEKMSMAHDAVLGEVIADIEEISTVSEDNYLVIDKEELKNLLGNYFV